MNVHTICTHTEKEQARNLFATKLFWVFASKNCQRVNSGWEDINMQILIFFMTVDTELNLMMLIEQFGHDYIHDNDAFVTMLLQQSD